LKGKGKLKARLLQRAVDDGGFPPHLYAIIIYKVMSRAQSMRFNQKQIGLILTAVKSLYLFIFVLAVAILLLSFMVDVERFMAGFLSFGLTALISGSVFFGLHKRKAWVIPTIVLLSVFGLIGGFFSFPETVVVLAGKWFGIIWAIFMLYFFTRKEVREYFGSKGIFVFS